VLGLIGTKVGMAQIFREGGELVPVTVVKAGPCTVTQVRTRDVDGYDAIQLGFGEKRRDRLTRADFGQARATRGDDAAGYVSLAEVRVDNPAEYKVGQELKLSEVFAEGDRVDVTGTTKGKGFSGVVRRYGFAGQTATHGTHESFRGAGGIGACAYPGKVFKGKRMAGHMGNVRRTVQNLEIVSIREDEDLLLVKGALPGSRGCEVLVRRAVKGE